MNLTLVIMAAGMGSRFGGLKQIEPVGPNKEIISDYSVYDAIKAGFKRIVFIIRKEHLDYFKNNITNKFNDKIEVDFAFQELDMVPSDVVIPKEREKMLGTGHAILCAKDKIDGDFVVINADDFYGADAYKEVVNFFKNSTEAHEYVSINYPYDVTKSDNGKVKRGVVITDNEYITSTLESEIGEEDGKIIAHTLSGDKVFEIDKDQAVSMNFFGFKKTFLDFLENDFNDFIHSEITLKNEFLLPEILKKGIEENNFIVKSILTNSLWMGVTYKEDLDKVKANIKDLVDKGIYPNNLWGNYGR